MSKSTSTSKDMTNNSTQNQMPEIYREMATKAMKHLDLVKAQYAVILPDGTVFNNSGEVIQIKAPKVKKAKKTRAERKMPHGAYSKVYLPTIQGMKVGDVQCFSPTPEMVANGVNLRDLQGTISTFAHGLWGNDAHKTHQNTKANCVELLRMA